MSSTRILQREQTEKGFHRLTTSLHTKSREHYICKLYSQTKTKLSKKLHFVLPFLPSRLECIKHTIRIAYHSQCVYTYEDVLFLQVGTVKKWFVLYTFLFFSMIYPLVNVSPFQPQYIIYLFLHTFPFFFILGSHSSIHIAVHQCFIWMKSARDLSVDFSLYYYTCFVGVCLSQRVGDAEGGVCKLLPTYVECKVCMHMLSSIVVE